MSGEQSTAAVLRLALATIRTRWISFVGAFFALVGGVAIVVPMLLTLAAALQTPFPGPQRFAEAPVVVTPHDTLPFRYEGIQLDMKLQRPAPLPPELVTRLSSAGRTVPDRTFDVRTAGGPAKQVGHGWSAAALGRYRLTAGRAPGADDQIVLASGSAADVGRKLSVDTGAGRQTFTVSGVVKPQWFESAVFFTDQAAARIEPSTAAAAVFASPEAVRQAVGNAANVLTGSDRKKADPDPSGGKDLLNGTEITAETTTAVVSFVAIFVVIATFAFVADLRRREMAQLRMIGATPRQMRRMIIGEAALIGVVASLVGCGIGVFGGRLVGEWLVDAEVAPGWFTVGVSWWPLPVGFATGLLSALGGSSVTAWRAGRVAPVEALRDAAVDKRVMTPTRWLLGIAALGSAVAVAASTISGSPTAMTNLRKVIDIPLLFVGAFALLLPVMAGPLVRWLTWPLTRMGTASMIVRANAMAAARRTAATAGAVVVAVGVAATFFIIQDNSESAVTHQTAQTVRADFVVLPGNGRTLPDATVAALRQVKGVQVAPVREAQVYVGSRNGDFIDALNAQVVDPADVPNVEAPALRSGSLRDFGPASLIVDQKASGGGDLEPGTQVSIWGPDGTKRDVTVKAVARTGLANDLCFLSSDAVTGGSPRRVDVRVLPGTAPAMAEQALRTAMAGQPAKVVSRTQALEAKTSDSNESSRTTTFLVLGIALIYSLVAVANTMVMASTGRRRELAALHLAGATRRQILWWVAAESAIAVALGAIVACFAGLSVLLVQGIAIHSLIGSFPVTIPWLSTGAVILACAGIGVLAATIAAANAMRGRVTELAGIRE
ncbi:ABC transporter permease [Actinomadura rubrisoli]|uniref:ABC transporter permease n=1 Tax=Actinomadura rubrisoli TaxID=2530368 RepID=A0A4V2YYW8_9ACTN|nr:ABC transporter permease [Actinomadura rubrisoli]TDD94827.1 ABC transporter permease [Actinomadura rubrisoli]